MSLSEDDVGRIAHLARLAIEGDELPRLAQNLSTIIDFVEQMNAVDTSNVSPMAHPIHATQRLREDAVTESDQRELFQQHAPLTAEGLYLVPRVIES